MSNKTYENESWRFVLQNISHTFKKDLAVSSKILLSVLIPPKTTPISSLKMTNYSIKVTLIDRGKIEIAFI